MSNELSNRQARELGRHDHDHDHGHHHIADLQQWAHKKKNNCLRWLEGKDEMTEHEAGMEEMYLTIRTYRGLADDQDREDEKPWVDRTKFDIFSTCVIMANAVLIGLDVDSRREREDGFDVDDIILVWIILEAIFCLFFVVEVLLKIGYHSWKWIFYELWNFYSTLAAFLMVADFALMAVGIQAYLRVFSILRVAGFLRLGRIFKRYRVLKELRLLVQGFNTSLSTIAWTSMLMFVVLYVCSALLTEQIGRNAPVYDEYRKMSGGWDHLEFFGTVGKSMYTLLQVATFDAWCSDIVRHVVGQQWYMGLFFVAFLLIVNFGLLNVVISVIVEHMLAAAQKNASQSKVREDKARLDELALMEDIFHEAEKNHSGHIDLLTFLEATKSEKVQWELRQLQLPVGECAKLFSVIGGAGSRSLSMPEFIKGCSQLKGTAQSKDLLAIQAQADILSFKMDDLGDCLMESELMVGLLDEISLRTLHRMEPAVEGHRRKLAHRVGGSAPMVPPKKDYRREGDDNMSMALGNRPELPQFPSLLF
jgi:voltage-gated sodium channel